MEASVKIEFDPNAWLQRRKRPREEDDNVERDDTASKRVAIDDVVTCADDFDDIPIRRTQQRHEEQVREVVAQPEAQKSAIQHQNNATPNSDVAISPDVIEFLNDAGGFLSARNRRVSSHSVSSKGRYWKSSAMCLVSSGGNEGRR